VADPFAPEEIGFAPTGEQEQAPDGIALGDCWACAAVAEAGMYFFEITTPSEPRLVAVYDLPSGVTGIAVSSDRAYLSNCFDGLRVSDSS